MAAQGKLPVEDVLDDLVTALRAGNAAVLVAPPGAGKTTGVPPRLLGEPWLGDGKILMLEPRRIAARAAAERMASVRGERVGETVGLRARLDTRVGPATRIEVVTEGVFTRLILHDPALEGVGAVIFDEFHERSLDADLGLALALDAQAGLREDLRLLVMSATLDGARVARLLADAPVIEAAGRAYPVDTRYVARPSDARAIGEAVADCVLRAMAEEQGSALTFLPGQAEIRRALGHIEARTLPGDLDVMALHGGLDAAAQRAAIQPPAAGRRKVVLATAIAQTSITIEGVRIVVDSGLERVPRYDAEAGVTRLETVRASRATVDQRRGRAGRTEPGVCYRLWPEPETQGLVAFTTPEILSADLAGLLLDCAAWGVTAPETLKWLDPPRAGTMAAARETLQSLGALDDDGRLTPLGRQLRALGLAPPLAAMVLNAAERGAEEDAALVAAILSERGAGGTSVDLDERIALIRGDRSPRAQSLKRLAKGWAATARDLSTGSDHASPAPASTAALLALAFPGRIAKARGPRGTFLMANGRAARVDGESHLADAPFLAVAEVTGAAAAGRIQGAAYLDENQLEAIAAERIVQAVGIHFEPQSGTLRARAERRLGAIVLASEPRPVQAGPEAAAALARGVAEMGIARMAWSKAQLQLRQRIAFVRSAQAEAGDHDWPDLSDASLAATAETWLAPFIAGLTRAADIGADRLGAALEALVPWHLRQRLDGEAPTHFEAPTGNRHAIDYGSAGAPLVACRVQELYGLKAHPAIAGGRLPLTLQLLSPAGRPIQITRDLPGFWSGSWRDVKSEMKGRYPKHVWPDEPASAQPTTRAKPRGS